MLSVYTRHYPPCQRTDLHYRRCRCPKLSRKWHAWKPYVRYNYLNAPEMEPIFIATGRQDGPAGGLRYDVNESVALKLQFDHLDRRALSAVNTVTMQTSFVF